MLSIYTALTHRRLKTVGMPKTKPHAFTTTLGHTAHILSWPGKREHMLRPQAQQVLEQHDLIKPTVPFG